jgi:iron(III) transport system ATP-binding protein
MANVTITNISKTFGETVAVRDFSVEVHDGELLTFLGPSGCGKTTTLRLVAGFISPSEGMIRIGERVVADVKGGVFLPPEERGVGMVFQSYAVWPHMTVFANVAYPLKIKRLDKAAIQRRAGRALELVRMPELAERYPHQLSGGQQQRVALARALVMDPDVLLLDEPLSNLDAKLREEMRLELKELQQKTGLTIIFVTHDQLEAMVLSDRVVVMSSGLIQQIGTPRDIYRNPANRFVAEFIGVANFIECFLGEDGILSLDRRPEITLPVSPPAQASVGSRLTLMVRPEEILLRESGEGQAIIEKKIFVGDAAEYILALGDTRLRAKADADIDLPVGSRVSFTFKEHRVVT